MGQRTWISRVAGIVVISLSLVLFCSVLFFVYVRSYGKGLEGNESVIFHEYQYFSLNTETGESSFSFVSLPMEIGEGGYYSNQHDQVLLSNIGSQEYICEGTCYCDQQINRERRSVSSPFILRSGLIYLLTAVSSVLAFQKAKEHFNDECVQKNEERCLSESIVSEVNNCVPIDREEENSEEERVEYLWKSTSDQPFGMKIYHCQGNCLRKKFRTKRAKDLSLNFGCESLILEEEIVIVSAHDVVIQNQERMDDIEQSARYMFQEKHLREFCYSKSTEKDVISFNENGEKYFMKKEISLCIGSNKMGINPSIVCNRMD